MARFTLSTRSLARLEGVHPDLVRVVHRAIELNELGFIVTEGLRTIVRQQQLVAAGASTTLHSRHLTGHAVDLAALVGVQVRWDWPLYARLNAVVQRAAVDCGVVVEWGGNWTEFKDGPHFELNKAYYK